MRFTGFVFTVLLCCAFASSQSNHKKATHNTSSGGPSCGVLNPNVDTIAVADFDTPPQYGHANPTLDLSTDVTESEGKPLINTGFPSNGNGAGIEYIVTKCTTGLADRATLVEIDSHEIGQCGHCGQGPGCGQNPGGGVGFYPVWTQKAEGSLLTVDVSMAMVGSLAGRPAR